MADVTLLAVVLFVGVGGMVLLYLAIESETDGRPRMDRGDAERLATNNAAERYARGDDADDESR